MNRTGGEAMSADGSGAKAPRGPQRCPVCRGHGILPHGFYGYPPGTVLASTVAPERCRTCDGVGFMGAPDIADPATEERFVDRLCEASGVPLEQVDLVVGSLGRLGYCLAPLSAVFGPPHDDSSEPGGTDGP